MNTAIVAMTSEEISMISGWADLTEVTSGLTAKEALLLAKIRVLAEEMGRINSRLSAAGSGRRSPAR